MCQDTAWIANQATVERAEAVVDNMLDWLRPQLVTLVVSFWTSPTAPLEFQRFESNLAGLVRELARRLLEHVLNWIEGEGDSLPVNVWYDNQGYRRLVKKTRNAYVATLFGTICLWRFPYRFWCNEVREKCIFPLELQLGLLEGVTPALSNYLGKALANAGASQRQVLAQLREQCGVAMGVKRLRKFLTRLSSGLAEFREATQVEALLDAIKQAAESCGNRKPVLAVGRDGTTLCEHQHSFWQVATAATVSVFDRSGKRVTTIYLAWRPELGQATLTRMLTNLINETLTRWEGPLPTLAYITDAGDHETSFFDDVLKNMLHPRTNSPLHWQRVVDFYHTAIRIWTMANCLFGKDTTKGAKWAKRMLHKLRHDRRGSKRVLHSAAALVNRLAMSTANRKEFAKAYRYIQQRTRWMSYPELKNRHIPIGSGITEAACKTVYTQRLKLSGMRWSLDGAQDVLTLRTIRLSGVWDACHQQLLQQYTNDLPQTYVQNSCNPRKTAA